MNQYQIGKDGGLILKKKNTIKSFYTGLGGIQIKEKKYLDSQPERISILKKNMNSNLEKISLPTSEGYFFVEIKNIVRCEAQGNYTQFYFKDGSKVLVSKTLKGYESILSDLHFFRINRSQLVNLKCIKIVGR
ncbi:MAG: LytR/AlgR family response regulator transcription factor [Saprospiraceae bacterium]